MQICHIDDPNDPRIAAYHKIRERDLTGRDGLFVAEGKVVLNVLFSAKRFDVESVLILENRLDGVRAALYQSTSNLPVYTASANVMDQITGFHVHRGVLAVGRKRVADGVSEVLEALATEALIVVLVGISNHDNMGAIFRNAAAFGADAVLLDETSCDPLYRKSIRVSVGAVLRVPFAVGGTASEIMNTLTHLGFEQFALSPAGTTDIRDIRRSNRTALYLGTEGEGLPPTLMAQLKTARIEMAPGFDSLNVAAASAIALHHFQQSDTQIADLKYSRQLSGARAPARQD
ncbi:RNA methyltransferase [Mesorhizobium sp. NBSH29]|uniref:TrmH family RNA methyltransferase n=1 Tax=Mesorhizobium sp. NBSH29 TaxID=2654249 RepID=UPI001896986F|nr:RNA methyltransferase [Mesorhizobium sp. NBSH29]QPC85343.1 RNA methyltransferase [Mesorhizobium sp. NBSH29]